MELDPSLQVTPRSSPLARPANDRPQRASYGRGLGGTEDFHVTVEAYPVHPGFVSMLLAAGFEPSALEREAGLLQDQLKTAGATLSAEEYHDLFVALERLDERDDFPLGLIDNLLMMTTFLPLVVAVASGSLDQAMERFLTMVNARYPGTGILRELPGGGIMCCLTRSDAEPAPPRGLVLFRLCSMVEIGRIGTGRPITPLEVVVALPRQELGAIEAYLGCPIRFGEQTKVSFAAQDVRLPFHTANPEVWRLLGPEVSGRSGRGRGPEPIAAQVRAVLAEREPLSDLALTDAARALGLSARTLQRRLRQEGTGYRALVDEVLCERAERLLIDTDTPVTEVGDALGFADASSFFRAFRRWTGLTPGSFRESAGGSSRSD